MFLTLATSTQIVEKFYSKNSVLPQCAQPRNRKHCKKLTTRLVLFYQLVNWDANQVKVKSVTKNWKAFPFLGI